MLKDALQKGEINLKGQFILGYNDTFLTSVRHQAMEFLAVYKPRRGEQPLWDFPPHSLARREVAAFLFSQLLGWDLVPVTILREDGPLGPGSLQQFIKHDANYHYFTFSDADRQRLRLVALFDLLVNNADRKGGHILIEHATRHLWTIDHGLCFHEEDKLRTVVWDFAGEEITKDLLSSIERMREQLSLQGDQFSELQRYLTPSEIDALNCRAQRLLNERHYPHPPIDRRAYPYPPI